MCESVSVEVCAEIHRTGNIYVADVVLYRAVRLYLYKGGPGGGDEAHSALAGISDVILVCITPVDEQLLEGIPGPVVVHVEVVGIVESILLNRLLIVVQREVRGYAVRIIVVNSLVCEVLRDVLHSGPQRIVKVNVVIQGFVHVLAHAGGE